MISFIRDYLEILSDSAASTASLFEIVQVSLKFFLTSFSSFVGYLLTFGWIRDLLYLPIVLPKWQEAILSEHFFSTDLNINLFDFLSNSSHNGFISIFILGFLNSFICCLPLSTVHFLSMRRLFVQGLTAGVASIVGMIFGQTFFIALVIFGVRVLLIPWFNLDPLNYFLGFAFLFMVIYDMASEKRIRPVEISEQNVLIKIFIISFILSLTEQANLAQYFSTLNFSNQSSLLTLNGIGSFGTNFSYILGLFLGQVFFSLFLLALTLFIRKSLLTISGLPYSVWLKQTNFLFLTFLVGCNLSSIPYYGLDYLLTKPLGFVSQDKIFEESFLTGNNIKDPSRLLTSVDSFSPISLDTNISQFDRDNYGDQTRFFKHTFEELNYQGEYAWLIRRDKKPDLYSSGETTKTRIRNLFQGEEAQSDKKSPEVMSQPERTSNDNPNQLIFDSIVQSNDKQKLRKRFVDFYDETKEKDNFLIGESFESFPLLGTPQTPAEITLKQKYYANGVYKNLLNTEIDAFLNRQPKEYALTSGEEVELFKKRSALSQYYDTIRVYEKIPYQLEFKDIFQGSKSFVDRPYNHQFKGNLHVVRRLFAVTLDNNENEDQKSILKYDMPLFRDPQKNQNYLLHEELTPQSITNKPFLEFNDSTPFYLGWDNQSRQMILTQRFLPTADSLQFPTSVLPAGSPVKQLLKELKQSASQAQQIIVPETYIDVLKSTNNSSSRLEFTTWPLDKYKLKELKAKANNKIITLYEPLENPEMNTISSTLKVQPLSEIFTNENASFPVNMKYLGKVPDHLVPNTGGLVWPGN